MSDYSLGELCDLAGVSPRTVRYYIAEGLLRTPGQGPGARYDEGHLGRLRLIRRLQREHLPLAEIRSRLRALDDASVQALLAAPEPDETTGSAVDYVRAVLAGGRPATSAVPPAAASLGPPARAALAGPSMPTPSVPPEPERSQWERIALTPDLELHVRRPLTRLGNRQLARLLEAAREILREGEP